MKWTADNTSEPFRPNNTKNNLLENPGLTVDPSVVQKECNAESIMWTHYLLREFLPYPKNLSSIKETLRVIVSKLKKL